MAKTIKLWKKTPHAKINVAGDILDVSRELEDTSLGVIEALPSQAAICLQTGWRELTPTLKPTQKAVPVAKSVDPAPEPPVVPEATEDAPEDADDEWTRPELQKMSKGKLLEEFWSEDVRSEASKLSKTKLIDAILAGDEEGED